MFKWSEPLNIRLQGPHNPHTPNVETGFVLKGERGLGKDPALELNSSTFCTKQNGSALRGFSGSRNFTTSEGSITTPAKRHENTASGVRLNRFGWLRLLGLEALLFFQDFGDLFWSDQPKSQ